MTHSEAQQPTGTPLAEPAPHYDRVAERRADLIVHLTGLAFALLGVGMLMGITIGSGQAHRLWAIAIYGCGLVAMLALSTAYNFSPADHQPLLRRLDHAGIFLMIAGSYTPFTTQHLYGLWAWAMTSAVWAIAILGATAKLLLPGLGKGFWIFVYLTMGWLMLIAIKPMFNSVGWAPLILLAIGGLLYTLGVLFYANKSLPFRRAIWHGHVVAAAAVHWTAILLAVTRR